MTYHYDSSNELYGPAQNSTCSVGGTIDPHSEYSQLSLLPKCSIYYVNGLYRQHTMPALFHDFSSQLGRAYLIDSPSYYVACVSAGTSDARSVAQDGVMTLRYMRKGVKDMRGCPVSFPRQSAYGVNGTTIPNQQSSFPSPSWNGASTTAPSYMTPTGVINDHAQGTWWTARLSVARTQLAATSVGNVAIFAGGTGPVPYAVDLYNSASGTWSTAQLSVGRFGLAATSVGNVAIFAGGSAGMFRVALCQGVRLLVLICVRYVL
jgi:hypothetical protein